MGVLSISEKTYYTYLKVWVYAVIHTAWLTQKIALQEGLRVGFND